jgi:hypothetical protein
MDVGRQKDSVRAPEGRRFSWMELRQAVGIKPQVGRRRGVEASVIGKRYATFCRYLDGRARPAAMLSGVDRFGRAARRRSAAGIKRAMQVRPMIRKRDLVQLIALAVRLLTFSLLTNVMVVTILDAARAFPMTR